MSSSLTHSEFDVIAAFLKSRSGLSIGYDKLYLLESRLLPVLRQHSLSSMKELAAVILKGVLSSQLAREVTDAMTINESMFFRDTKPFNQLRDIVLPALLQHKNDQIRIWNAACSHGQEAYSVAMILRQEAAQLNGIRTEIIGTDIAEKVLERAKSGIYTQFEVQRGLPIALLMKYFSQRPSNKWQVSDVIRDAVTFEVANLLDNFAATGPFDIVMCRNVLIYFDDSIKADVLKRISGVMPSGRYLFLGSSETILGLSDQFTPVEGCPGLFIRI